MSQATKGHQMLAALEKRVAELERKVAKFTFIERTEKKIVLSGNATKTIDKAISDDA